MSNDEDEVMIVSESPSTMSRSCSMSSVRMREVRVSLTDCRRSSSSPGTESPRSPAKVPTPLSASKRGRGRPRKSLPTPDTLKITSPSPKCKITNYFKAKVLTDSENSASDNQSPRRGRGRRPGPLPRTPVRGRGGDNKENEEASEDNSDGGAGCLLKFVDSAGHDITDVVKTTMSPEKRTPTKHDPAINVDDSREDLHTVIDNIDPYISEVESEVAPAILATPVGQDAEDDQLSLPSVSALDQLLPVSDGPKVAVETSPAVPMEEVIRRLSGEKTDQEESDQEAEVFFKEAAKSADTHEFSADDEEDSEMEEIVPTSSVWSSFNTIIQEEPVLESVATKSKSPKKTKAKNKDQTPLSSGKKYQRSKRMSTLIDDGAGTDTDDGAEQKSSRKSKPSIPVLKLHDYTDDDVPAVKRVANSDTEINYDQDSNVAKPKDKDVTVCTKDESNNIIPKRKSVTFADAAEVAEEAKVENAKMSEAESEAGVVSAAPCGLLEVVWARIGSHPWWPALVCNDPDTEQFSRVKPRLGHRPVMEVHVTFFGENTRAWVVSFILALYYPISISWQ